MVMTVNAKNKDVSGSYRNAAYDFEGLRNPDGSLVEGINYTPTYNYGWLVDGINAANYRPDLTRKDFADIKALGFNSVRLMCPFGMWIHGNETALKEIMDNYEDLFIAARENGLTVDVVTGGAYSETDYDAEDSYARLVLKTFVERFDEAYRDVIVMWEVANEPDLNIYGQGNAEEQYKTNQNWNNVMKPYLTWGCRTLKEYGAKIPVSIGAMTSSLYSDWDAETFDVINLHPYLNTLENCDKGFTSAAAGRDLKVNGRIRPIVFTEVAWVSGNLARTSDIMQYCRENNIAYYVWGWMSNSYEQNIQGIMNANGVLRSSTLPYNMFQAHSSLWPVATAGFDDLPTGGGANILGSLRAISERIKIKDTKDLAGYLQGSAQAAHSQLGALAPYWTADFRELVLTAKGSTLEEKLMNVMTDCSLSLLPYIRTYGDYENDNALGGTLQANYYENTEKYNTSRGQTIWRTRFTADGGRNGSQGILMGTANTLLLKQPLDPAKTYTVSVDVKPAVDGTCGIGIACGAESGQVQSLCFPGLTFRVSHEKSEAAQENPALPVQAANTVQVYLTNDAGTTTWKSAMKIDPSLYDKDGYINISVTFTGNGTRENPLHAEVYSGEKKLGDIDIKSSAMSADDKYIALSCENKGVNCFDNLVLSEEGAGVILSDSFESGKHDYDYLTYDLTKKVQGVNNVGYFEEAKKAALVMLGGSVSHKVPENLALYVCDGLLAVTWDYSGVGESGFELQRSRDGGRTWKAIWRSMSGTRSMIVPLYETGAENDLYRLSPVTAENETKKFTDGVRPSIGKGAGDGYLASFTDGAGKTHTVEVIGNGVFLTEDVNEIPEGSTGLWVERYVTRTDAKDSNIRNEKPTKAPEPEGDDSTDDSEGTGNGEETDDGPSVKSEKKPSKKLLTAIAEGVIVLALAAIGFFGCKLILSDNGKKK